MSSTPEIIGGEKGNNFFPKILKSLFRGLSPLTDNLTYSKGGYGRGVPLQGGYAPMPKGGVLITFYLLTYSPPLVDNLIRYCQSVMLVGRDDGSDVYDPKFNVLPNLSSCGMAGDL